MKRIKIDYPDAKEIFINALNDNQVIAYPTDTIYAVSYTHLTLPTKA